ncbi:MAG: PepSY-associated TM helix domain-containing protein [Parahaliea sp.]
MFANFRQAMAWLHTWFGLVLGYVLMVAFFFGALSVFDREIDRWALPDTRFEAQPMPSYDEVLAPVYARLRAHPDDMVRTARRVHGEIPDPDTLPMASQWAYTTHRDPVLRLGGEYSIPNKPIDASDDHQHVHGWGSIDPRTGEFLSEGSLKIGSEFFYPLHYSLHLTRWNLGYWIVGLAALMMLMALVSGVVIHRKLFKELFTFRPHKQTQRSVLDLHNMTGVVALPFHFFFAFTGLVIFANIYLPLNHTMLKPLHEQHELLDAQQTGLPHEPAGVVAPLASVDAMVAEAKRRWLARDMPGEPGFLVVEHLGDSNGYVSIYRAGSDQVALVGQGVHFKASTGEVLREDPPLAPVFAVNEFLTGLHLQHFRHWLLRWLYVLGGLSGCVCIATGFLFFTEKRKRQLTGQSGVAVRWVDALAITAVTGMLVATVAMLVSNRLLPVNMAARGDWQEVVFWLSWLAALIHAFARSGIVTRGLISPAWREQCWLFAALAMLAVLLNWLTTGDHLIKTVGEGYWPVAGVDLALLVSAGIAIYAARLLRRKEAGKAAAIAAHSRNSLDALEPAHG